MTPKKAYTDQKHHSKARGIEWCFTYEDWILGGKRRVNS